MKHTKVLNLVFLLAAALVWFLALHYVSTAIAYYQLPRRLGGSAADAMHHGLPILLGLATFFILRGNTKISYFVSDSLDELMRVVFPGPKEVRMGTILVITLVIFAGIIFGGLDWVITSVVKTLIGIKS